MKALRGLLLLLLLLVGLALLLPAGARPEQQEVLGYWLHADGRVTEFVRGPDGRLAGETKRQGALAYPSER